MTPNRDTYGAGPAARDLDAEGLLDRIGCIQLRKRHYPVGSLFIVLPGTRQIVVESSPHGPLMEPLTDRIAGFGVGMDRR